MVRRATVRQTLVTTGVALLVTARAGAQGSALLRGVVYDSLISAAPLEGAEVWIEGTNRTARTDALGRFELAALAAGRYRLTFEHPVLDSTGLAAPPVVVDVAADGATAVTLATPVRLRRTARCVRTIPGTRRRERFSGWCATRPTASPSLISW